MPSTVNGIGTTYFGTWNRQVQDGVCESCHQRGKLVSYETWHCICVLFIPIIPLGKKQVLNYCPSCTAHRVLPFREWTKIRDAAIGETIQEVSSSPDDPDAAMKMHATLAAFQKGDEAAKFAAVIEQKFSGVANLQFYLAAWYERIGNSQIANRLFLHAFDLAPDNIDYRRAALLTLVEEGKLDEAKALVDPFLPGNEHYQIPVCYTLAMGYQKHGQHEEAVQLFKNMLTVSPGLKTDKAFRKTLIACEKALGLPEMTLPPDPFYRSSGFLWTTGLLVIATAVAGYNYYIAMNRTIHIVNGFATSSISVKMDGGPPIEVVPRGRKELTLPEGTHEVEVIAPRKLPKVAFAFSSSWWERFVRKPVYVIDASRSAEIRWEEATYVPAGQGAQAPDNRLEVHLGEVFTTYKHIDYPFAEFPAEIKMKSASKPMTKTRVVMATEKPEVSVQIGMMLGTSPGSLLEFMETHLEIQPELEDLLRFYAYFAMTSKMEEVARQFLGKHLTDRPVRIPWHRYYQIIGGRGLPPEAARNAHEKLKKEYDQQLAQEPGNPSLLYLRGRLEDRAVLAAPFFERALSADPKHPYALYASSHQQMMVGNFDEALDLLKRAVAAKPGDAEFEAVLTRARIAARDFNGAEGTAREHLKSNPFETSSLETLLKVLVSTDRVAEAEREAENFSTIVRQRSPNSLNSTSEHMKWFLAAIKGDFAALEPQVINRGDPVANRYAFFARLQLDQLANVPSEAIPSNSYWHFCREWVAKRLGKVDEAAASHAAALEALDRGGSHDWCAADAIRQAKTIAWEDIAGLSDTPSDKAIVLVLLARERQDLQSQLLDLAERLNFDLEFPHFLIQREIEEMRSK